MRQAVTVTMVGASVWTTGAMLESVRAAPAPVAVSIRAFSAAASKPVATTPQDVLQFWFEDSKDREGGQGSLWFGGGEKIDNEIKEKFSDLLERAKNGELESWHTGGNPSDPAFGRQTLAYIILIDQFSRNIHRGTPRAFELDSQVVQVTRKGLVDGRFQKLEKMERQFAYLPLMHSEKLADQDLCIEAMQTLENPGVDKFAEEHREAIARFGRFPHRNAILGRKSTPEEIEYLKTANNYGQTVKK